MRAGYAAPSVGGHGIAILFHGPFMARNSQNFAARVFGSVRVKPLLEVHAQGNYAWT